MKKKEEPETATPKEESLQEAIELTLKFLAERDLAGLYRRFMAPDEKEDYPGGMTRAEFASRYLPMSKEELAGLVDVMKHIKNEAPKMSEDGSKATFDVRSITGRYPRGITFKKIDGRWYFGN